MLGFLPARLREVESLAPEIETPFFFRLLRQDSAGRRRTQVSGSVARRLHRQSQLRAFERSDRPGAAEERLRSFDSRRIKTAAARCMCMRESAMRRANSPGGTSMRFWTAASTPSSPTRPDADPRSRNIGNCWSTIRITRKKSRRFSALVKDVNEFLASIDLNPRMKPVADRRHLPGFLPLGARTENPLRAPQAARFHPRP